MKPERTLLVKSRALAAFVLALLTFFFGHQPKRTKRSASADWPLPPNAADRFWRELAVQDWVCLVYLLVLLGCTLAGDGPRRARALLFLVADLVVFFGAVVLTRARLVTGAISALVYRLGLVAAIFGSFSHLQYVLPTVRSDVVDASLYAFDLSVFGVEPAIVFDRFVSTTTTEWFSFFYFAYFFLLASHVIVFMFGVRRARLIAEFSFGIVALFCVGHLLYIVVPGRGPYHHLASAFQHDLDGPFWWRLVKTTVDSAEGSARTDIFPSLHTALPTYLALFAVRRRAEPPFRFLWIPLTIFASQIQVSTMFLRWHYLVDVLAGLLLAFAVSVLGPRVATWEARRRDELGKQPVWTSPWRSDLRSGEEDARRELHSG